MNVKELSDKDLFEISYKYIQDQKELLTKYINGLSVADIKSFVFKLYETIKKEPGYDVNILNQDELIIYRDLLSKKEASIGYITEIISDIITNYENDNYISISDNDKFYKIVYPKLFNWIHKEKNRIRKKTDWSFIKPTLSTSNHPSFSYRLQHAINRNYRSGIWLKYVMEPLKAELKKWNDILNKHYPIPENHDAKSIIDAQRIYEYRR